MLKSLIFFLRSEQMAYRFLILFLFQICSISLFATSSPSTWVIDRDKLEQHLPLGVTVDGLTTLLEKEGIAVKYEKTPNDILWRGKHVSITLSPAPFSPYHLWVSINDKTSLDECTAEELTELYSAILISKKAISDVTGADGFMIFTTEQPRRGKENTSVGFEIIPSGFGGSRGVMDAVTKNALNEYVFYNQGTTKKISYELEDIDKIRRNLQSLQPTVVKEEKLAKAWSQKLSRHNEALHHSLQSIYTYIRQTGALIEGEMPSPFTSEDDILEIRINLDKCAFCNPKVINKQLVCSWKDIHILMSHKPISPYGNFLIIPKRHQCAWDLTQKEALASFEAIISLKKYFNQSANSNNWICYIQDGPSVGQTVPHAHIHFFILPHPLKMAMTNLQHIHNQRPILSYEQMRADCSRIQPQLLEELHTVDLDAFNPYIQAANQ
jgi:diadenosine tetraphosphate (Ap4A) HIT family hydrolase